MQDRIKRLLWGEFLGTFASEKTGSSKAAKKATLGVANRATRDALMFPICIQYVA
jgi:hypothetical protein